MSNLASTLDDQGKLDKEELMQKVILEKMRHMLGEDHPATITAMNNLASTYMNRGRW